MRTRKWTRPAVLATAIGLTSLPAFLAFGRPGDGTPFQQLQKQLDELRERVGELEDKCESQTDRIAALESLLVHFSRDGDDVTISGANLHVVNGTGRTDSSNGLGNVIVGYNESRVGSPSCIVFPGLCTDDRTGSHMLVNGSFNNYSSYGGIVVGTVNTASGAFASVSGGRDNEASGMHASVSGGSSNHAAGFDASVSGGSGNVAGARSASVSGGIFNAASGPESSVSGGSLNDASGTESSVCGGTHNEASGELASIGGGIFNEASGQVATIGGGTERLLTSSFAWQAADLVRIDGPP